MNGPKVCMGPIVFPDDFTDEEKFIAEVVKQAHAKDLEERVIDTTEELLLRALEREQNLLTDRPITGFKAKEEIGMGVINTAAIKRMQIQTKQVTTPSRKLKTKWSSDHTFKQEVMGEFHEPTDV